MSISLWLLVSAVSAVIAAFLFSIFPFHRICLMWECRSTQSSTLTKANARVLFAVWLALYLSFGFRNEI